MAIRVALSHKTRYRYAQEVWLSPHVVRLRPAPHCRTPVLSYSLKVTPGDHFINWQQDPYSNRLARLVFPKKTREFAVEVDLIAELTVINPFDFFVEAHAETYPFQYDAVLARELAPYLETTKDPGAAGPGLQRCVERLRRTGIRTIDYLVELNRGLQQNIRYLVRLEPGIQSPEETLALGSGSCRDSAWLLVQILRHLGLAARFVSGYLIQLAPDVKSLDGPSGAAADFTDLHAWAEVYLPGAGWVGLDPTSGLLAGEGHIPLACTADPTTAAAVTGYFSIDNAEVVKADPGEREGDMPAGATGNGHGGNGHASGNGNGDGHDGFEFSMTVTRIHEDPRVTKPYSDEAWSAIESLGHQVDADLKSGDVRLTMGGEPTFVSIDDMDGAEWNSAAQGPQKYKLADQLLRRLRDRFAAGKGGFLHHGQGKWYPGESLPRWSLGLYWRKDGQPIWLDPSLVADESLPTNQNKASENDARGFIRSLAERLGIEQRFAVPGYEDAFYFLWKERKLPVNVDPFESDLDNEEDRAQLARVFEQGLKRVVGYALPLRRDYYTDGSTQWVSGAWFHRTERMYLLPGDSAMGYRLPLDSLPWVAETDREFVQELDPFAERGELPAHRKAAQVRQRALVGAMSGDAGREPVGYVEQILGPATEPREKIRSGARKGHPPELPPSHGESAPWIIRTALCAQARGGVLRVFMPPQRHLEDYLDLVTAVEDTARDLAIPVLVEGYTPPHDHRVHTIKVTPDPGVIEVNSAPATAWDELVTNTTALYEEARLARLGTEKFMLDGRHTGTGGGNHIVVGGPTPADSPLLRRPDLLRSLVGYWHNHPSLSYLFSGLFVGPTSQAPRLDEARNDQVYELEIAFNQIPDHVAGTENYVQYWVVDRIFRNILVDATGNTHRAEFCIDKLYAPESATGRLGLLEMRAFEMPPHARMSLTQQLVLRALIARFWKMPYKTPPVRWGTQLHDRFMLPHFVEQDFADVIAELNDAGYAMKTEWFAPHFEFRFPLYGTVEQRGVALELRTAIEPWHVLGEEPGGGATVRYVDSSVERLQVLVRGMIDPRHVVTCNGCRIPLHPTGVNGEFVAGVRYRAWRPPECLHPTIGVHAPLVFDIVDTWAGRSIGGCRYHVAHPGGLSYDSFPVNAYAAESRRIARFFKFGHTPGAMSVRELPVAREYPLTLDLRRG